MPLPWGQTYKSRVSTVELPARATVLWGFTLPRFSGACHLFRGFDSRSMESAPWRYQRLRLR